MTQRIRVGAGQHISLNPQNQRAIVVSSGPQGPPGASALPEGGVDGQVLGKLGTSTTWLTVGTSTEIDTKLADHNSATPVHPNATSGRDFAALFLNGLI